jgi:hypothetical protein
MHCKGSLIKDVQNKLKKKLHAKRATIHHQKLNQCRIYRSELFYIPSKNLCYQMLPTGIIPVNSAISSDQ